MAMSRVGNSEQIARGFHMKCESPFLERFVEERLLFTQRHEDFVSTMDLFTEYKSSVNRWTNGDSEREGHPLNAYIKIRRFQKQLMPLLRKMGVHPSQSSDSSKRLRGYRGVKIQKGKNKQREPEKTEDLTTRISHFIKEGRIKYEVRVVIDKDKSFNGKCGFASEDILKGEVVAEYSGDRISLEESARREAIYEQEENHPPAMFQIYGNKLITVIDPWPVADILPGNVHPVYFNHATNANLKPKLYNCSETGLTRVFFIATKDIPKTEQLLWNYNDKTAPFYNANTFA